MSFFDGIYGHERNIASLRKQLSENHFPQALLFQGTKGGGKRSIALSFAKEALLSATRENERERALKMLESGLHPDLFLYYPEGKLKLHSIDSLRELKENVRRPPTETSLTFHLIFEAERMLPTSANALLKCFEEPADHAVLILISNMSRVMLPTVVSRCFSLFFQPLPLETVVAYLREKRGVGEEEAFLWARCADGSIGRADALLEFRQLGLDELFTSLLSTPFLEEKEREKRIEQLFRWKKPPPLSSDLSLHWQERLAKREEAEMRERESERLEILFLFTRLWYREMELIRLSLPMEFSLLASKREALDQMMQRGFFLSTSWVGTRIERVHQLYDRSTAPAKCLEQLLFYLGLV